MPRAILDACVLYSQLLRDVLLRLAAAGLYEPAWSGEILDELRRHIPTSPGKAERTIALMQSAFPDAMVAVPPDSLDTLQTPPKDRHVLAAAIYASATLIVTHNIRDFPPHALVPYAIEAWTPDRFLTSLLQLDPGSVLAVLEQMSSVLHKPPLMPREIAEALGPWPPSSPGKHKPSWTDIKTPVMEPAPQAPRPKILVADQMPGVARFVRSSLERAGYTVLTASSYEEAVAVSRAEKLDLVVIQLMMPDTPMFLDGEAQGSLSPAPERRWPFFLRQRPRDEERTPLDRRLYPDAEDATPPYPIDAYIRSLQSAPEPGMPPVILTLDRAALLPHWSWEGRIIHAPPFTYITRPFAPSELLQHVRRSLPTPDI